MQACTHRHTCAHTHNCQYYRNCHAWRQMDRPVFLTPNWHTNSGILDRQIRGQAKKQKTKKKHLPFNNDLLSALRNE